MILGVGGKMGPTLAGSPRPPRPTAAYRRRALRDAGARMLKAHGIETIACDLLDDAAVETLPKLRTSSSWPASSSAPTATVDDMGDERARPGARREAFGLAHRRVLDRLRLSLRAGERQGADEDRPPNPPGEYAVSCLGRERMFEYFSQARTPGRLFRLNYAIDLRYGVLHDIAIKVLTASRSTSAWAMST